MTYFLYNGKIFWICDFLHPFSSLFSVEMYGRTTYPCNAMTNVSIPFLSQTSCAPISRSNKTSIGYYPPVRIGVAALSESDRIASLSCTAVVTQIAAGSCDGSQRSTGPQTTQVPVIPGGSLPYVAVGTVPASVSMGIQRDRVLATATNPYNPETRFSQYFPPAPIPYCRPIRYPSNDPKPSVNTCLPIRRFTGIPDVPGL
jgi:hypothetical protein